MALKEYILITNRGPNFKSGDLLHIGAGGTQDAYKILADTFAYKWICIASDNLESNNLISDFPNILSVQFIENNLYNRYYYEFISEFLYPTLLGHSHLATKLETEVDFLAVNKILLTSIKNLPNKSKIIICDYHLFLLPELIEWKCEKIFFWFLPFPSVKTHKSAIFKKIIHSLSLCNTIFFLTPLYASNFKEAFFFHYPSEKLKAKICVNIFGPNKDYLNVRGISQKKFDDILYDKFNIQNIQSRFILSVSRLDFVKNIPVLIKAFNKMMKCTNEENIYLIIVAPHHRKNSAVYQAEENIINELVKNSEFYSHIKVTNELFSRNELKILYRYSNIFVMSSDYDAMPLTPLEYCLSNNGSGDIIATETTGTPIILQNCPTFSINNETSLSQVLTKLLHKSDGDINTNMAIYKQKLKSYSHVGWKKNILKNM